MAIVLPCPVSPVGRLEKLAALTHRIYSVLVASVLRDMLGKACHGPGKGWVSEPPAVQHVGQGTSCSAVQCLGVTADFQPSQCLQGYFSDRAANPVCQLFKGMLFLLVQSFSGVKQGAVKQVSKETPECLLGRHRNPRLKSTTR